MQGLSVHGFPTSSVDGEAWPRKQREKAKMGVIKKAAFVAIGARVLYLVFMNL